MKYHSFIPLLVPNGISLAKKKKKKKEHSVNRDDFESYFAIIII